MNRGGVNIEDVLNSYSDHLRCKLPKNADRFGCTRKSSRESAIAEAITFHILGAMGVSPEIHDQVGTGGVDFICRSPRQPPGAPQDRFVVEATSLSPDAVSERSHIPNEARNGISGFALGRVTQNIGNKAKGKHKQLGGYPMPRVLAIATSHVGAPILFDAAAAKRALVSDLYFRHEIGSDAADPADYTDLRNSVFIKLGPDGNIVACRKEISAILLVAVYGGNSEVYGILHPESEYPLNTASLPNLPFVRISQWPVVNDKILVGWVINGNPSLVSEDPSGLAVRHSLELGS